jgi:hypothetical protein
MEEMTAMMKVAAAARIVLKIDMPPLVANPGARVEG